MTIDGSSGTVSVDVSRAISEPVSSWSEIGATERVVAPRLTKSGDIDPRYVDASGKKVGPDARAYRDRVDAGLVHVVEDLRYGASPWSRCSCGLLFEGANDSDVARAFNSHSFAMRRGDRMSGPVSRDEGDA